MREVRSARAMETKRAGLQVCLREAQWGRGRMLEIKVLGRRDCHLCTVVIKMARRMQDDMRFRLTGITIDDDPELSQRYGAKAPVVLIDDVEALWGRVNEGELRRAIKRARWRRPVSRILSRLRARLRRG